MVNDKKKLESNLWKMLLDSILHRRNFYPLLSIFLLSLPNTTAKMIGLSTGIGQVIAFLLETPSGYFADKFGHKKTIILSRIFMIISTISYIFANSFIVYLLGAIFTMAGFAFMSGAKSAFMHDTLLSLKRDKEYTKIMSEMSGNASFVSFFMIISLPFLTNFSIRLPFILYLFLDIIGLIICLSLFSPNKEISQEHKTEKIFSVLKRLSKTNFFRISTFFGIIAGLMFGLGAYRAVYLESLNFPITLIGLLGISRLVWFVLGHFIDTFTSKISFRKFMFFEIFFFSISYLLIAFLNNGYMVMAVLILSNGYFWARNQYTNNYYIEHFVLNPNYKATILSLRVQFQNIFVVIIAFTSGFLMEKSYKFGFGFFAIVLPIALIMSYFWSRT